jgi:transposase
VRDSFAMELTAEQDAELRALINSREVSAALATRARIVLWHAQGRARKDIGPLAGVSLPTVDRWVSRYAEHGLAGLAQNKPGGPRAQVPSQVRSRILALSRTTPPQESGLSHWSCRLLADYLARTEGITVSWHYIAKLWREQGLQPNRSSTYKASRDPAFAAKVADVVGLYLDPPGGAVVLSIDEKTQIQALDRTQPLLPIDFGATEKRTHDYKRHGTTNQFAALNVGTGEVVGSCRPSRNGAEFLAFLKKATAPHRGREIHVVLDNLSTHTTPDVGAWLAKNPHVTFHFTPVGSSWLNQIETWFGLITKQSIRRGTFSSVSALINQIRAYIEHWNTRAEPFVWTATADEILAKVRLVQTNIKKLVDNNAK